MLYGKDELVNLVHQWALDHSQGVAPGKVVHYDDNNPFAHGWPIVVCESFGIYIHRFYDWDNCGVMHDHPYDSMSLCLEGPMTEKYRLGDGPIQERIILRGDLVFRPSAHQHLLPYKQGERGLTLFITGPIFRDAYFFCPEGKIEYTKFVELGNRCLSTHAASKLLGLFGFGTTTGPTSPSN